MNRDYNQLLKSIEYRYNPESSAAVEQRTFTNSGKLLLLPYTKDFGRITRF